MITTKIVLYHRKNKDGKNPLAIRITRDRKSSYVFTGQAIDERDWNANDFCVRKSHPNSGRLNKFLIKKLAEVNDASLEAEMKEGSRGAKDVHATVVGSIGQSNFFSAADHYLSNLRLEGKYNRHTTDRSRLEIFKRFMEGRGQRFEDVNVQNLTAFKAFLISTHNLTERTAINYLIIIRTIYSKAIGAGLAVQENYPFGKGKIQIKFPDSDKIGLTKGEVKRFMEHDLEGHPKHNHARNVWLVAFYLAGMRVSDVFRLRWTDIRDGRLHYTMGKNSKAGSLKLPGQALKIISTYEGVRRHKDDVIFPELKIVEDFSDKYLVQRKISYGIKTINKYLKQVARMAGIDKPLTMHIARHSFAGISGEKVPIQILQKLYRHSSITTTIAYQNSFTTSDIDDALDAVVDF